MNPEDNGSFSSSDSGDAHYELFGGVEVDEDFAYLNQLIAIPDPEWESLFSSDVLDIYLKKAVPDSDLIIKCMALLPGIPRHIAFAAFADMNIRRQWDFIMNNLEVIEEKRDYE